MVTGRGYFPVGERGHEEATMSRKTVRVRLDQMHSTFDIRVDAKADQSARRAPQQD